MTSKPRARVWIALGSNLGAREERLVEAAEALGAFVKLEGLSHLYETAPMYVTDQPAFLNAVVVGETELGPIGLLKALKKIEADLGRLPRQRFGPRELDLDLLAYGSLKFKTDRLQLPHPKIGERRFVVLPLSEVSESVPILPPLKELLEQTDSQAADVRIFDDSAWDALRKSQTKQ